ncbi:MAG: RtcB family protein [Verrucomicrobia bacterium]|jgi:tRNA-splicing ligase RtcB|nr:RtcB family protein [Verrucomicrobiota bacterium]
MQFHQIGAALWEIPPEGGMRVPARIYATPKMLDAIRNDNASQQAANVAHLPGIVNYSLAMPDIHWGYGFPIGGVAAFDLKTGVISPGGVGYDINCGVRLMVSRLTRAEVTPRLRELVNQLFRDVPTGVGSAGALSVSEDELKRVVARGARWAVERGLGEESDLEYIEEHGCIAGAEPARVSARAWERGRGQLGTLGSGNHFLEVGYVSEVFDARAAQVLGLHPDQVTVIIHCGSRGFGYQVCEDYLSVMDRAVKKYGIELPDRQLACAPVDSEEGQAYWGAMQCAVNYAFANRQVIAHHTRRAFEHALGLDRHAIGLRTVYEVAHNIAKFEWHPVEGREVKLCIHRKGATRAFAPGRKEVPSAYQAIGQPVLIPGDMGRYSYVLTGTEQAMIQTFGSTCHGAGRALSRVKAKQMARGRNILQELEQRGILVRGQSRRTVDEEISEAYKDVSSVVDACALAGISNKVAQLRPLGCIKG